jgi:hypothetical protein
MHQHCPPPPSSSLARHPCSTSTSVPASVAAPAPPYLAAQLHLSAHRHASRGIRWGRECWAEEEEPP